MTVKSEPGKQAELNKLKRQEDLRIGIVVSEWNSKITDSLKNACVDYFLENGFSEKQLLIKQVPGSFELPLGAQYLIELEDTDAVCCLGCVIKGETPHFDFISEAVALKIADLNLRYNRPVSFGVITANTDEQAVDRAGGKKGNKGEEAAIAALKMLVLKHELKFKNKSGLGFYSE
jgi:6,7-dimethyl-8-ribityllumazine synthase